ncbi:hypothetical protein ACIGFL_04090 [Pseudomonas sp. NPDC077649]|uniref:hypothetical protein n=1 Tax=Pseudomonas sp. NPDC077649 TaxID=3364423 RepID=UPI0037CA2B3D
MHLQNSRFKPVISSEFFTLASMISNSYELRPTCYFFFRDGFWMFENWEPSTQDYYVLVHHIIQHLKPLAYSIFTSAPSKASGPKLATLYAATAYAGGQSMTFSRQFEVVGRHETRFVDSLQEHPTIFRANSLSRMFTDTLPSLPSRFEGEVTYEVLMENLRNVRDIQLKPYPVKSL